jgi:hypothetical protein
MDTCSGDEIKFKYNFSPLDWWAVRENNPDIEGFVKSLHIRIWSQLGGHLPVIEFTYNNNYQATIGMAPYEALYGRKCGTLVYGR